MKKRFLFLLFPLLLLSGCGGHDDASEPKTTAENYSLQDGRYALSDRSSEMTPYLLIHEGRYTVVKDIAVSYQPGGTIQRDGNTVTLEGKFANEDYCYTFTLTANDQLHFDLGQSKILKSQRAWTDGMVFSRAMDSASVYSGILNKEQEALLDSFPEYFGLAPENGLDVIVWQMAPSSYSFGLLEHSETPRDWISKELMDLKGVSAEQMREILATYAVSEEGIYIIPWQNPISSYLPAYCINYGGEDMDAKTEAYIAEIREMLFG